MHWARDRKWRGGFEMKDVVVMGRGFLILVLEGRKEGSFEVWEVWKRRLCGDNVCEQWLISIDWSIKQNKTNEVYSII